MEHPVSIINLLWLTFDLQLSIINLGLSFIDLGLFFIDLGLAIVFNF